MSHLPETIRPRLRRKPTSAEQATTLASASTRVLIRVPRVTVDDSLAAIAAAQATSSTLASKPSKPAEAPRPQPAVPAKTTVPTIGSALAVAATATTISPSAKPPSTTTEKPAAIPATRPEPIVPGVQRIDAAHTAVPAPHSAAPAWLEPQRGIIAFMNQRRTLAAAGLVLSVIIGGSLLRGGKEALESPEAPRGDAPKISAVKKEIKGNSRKTGDPETTAGKSGTKSGSLAGDAEARSAKTPRATLTGGANSQEPRIATSNADWDRGPAANAPAAVDPSRAALPDKNLSPPPPAGTNFTSDQWPAIPGPTLSAPTTIAPAPTTNPPSDSVEYPVTPYDPIPAMPATNPAINYPTKPPAGTSEYNNTRGTLPGVARFDGVIGKPPIPNAPSNTYQR